ncbi:MAG: membrane protein insertion efficiency factor YidD [Oscillospiraceae bacterium]|nr:membrane protein insertion efficiency factor YidD [Oscillospiraceae bacterium]
MIKRWMIRAIRFYKRKISPHMAPACKYAPTCSEYAIDAIEKYGAFKGFWMAVWRILRCNPFSKGGYDPVK